MAVSTGGVMAVEWCLYSTAVILALCRFGLHIHKKTMITVVADIWLLVAVVDCTALIACDTATYRAGAMDIFQAAPISIRKLRFATIYLFDFGLYFAKFSMLAFYMRIIPPTSPKMRKALYAVVGFVSCSAITSFFAITFWCGTDLSINWSDHEEACSVFSVRPLAQLNWSLNLISEVFIFLLPLPLIHGLHLQYRREKAGLICVFMLGLLTISASTARFIVQDFVTNNVPLYILAMTEYTISIIILSSISLRPLLRKIYSIATESYHSAPFSRSNATDHRRRTHDDLYAEALGLPRYGSEVELTEITEIGMGRIYKTEEISVTSAHETVSEEKERNSFGESSH